MPDFIQIKIKYNKKVKYFIIVNVIIKVKEFIIRPDNIELKGEH